MAIRIVFLEYKYGVRLGSIYLQEHKQVEL